jgi:hypothetical protein
VRLRGEAANLPLPLTPDAANAILQKATASKETDGPRWAIQSQDVEVPNPRWRAFVNKIAGGVWEPLGISEVARVHAALSKLALVRPGGWLPVGLVYDLVTTTIHEVPRAACLPVLHQALEASLTQFFELLPSHKRFKLSDDAWRTINKFAVDCRFVYPVTGDSFESLQGDDQPIAERLAAFCEHSNGQYVMYL